VFGGPESAGTGSPALDGHDEYAAAADRQLAHAQRPGGPEAGEARQEEGQGEEGGRRQEGGGEEIAATLDSAFIQSRFSSFSLPLSLSLSQLTSSFVFLHVFFFCILYRNLIVTLQSTLVSPVKSIRLIDNPEFYPIKMAT